MRVAFSSAPETFPPEFAMEADKEYYAETLLPDVPQEVRAEYSVNELKWLEASYGEPKRTSSGGEGLLNPDNSILCDVDGSLGLAVVFPTQLSAAQQQTTECADFASYMTQFLLETDTLERYQAGFQLLLSYQPDPSLKAGIEAVIRDPRVLEHKKALSSPNPPSPAGDGGLGERPEGNLLTWNIVPSPEPEPGPGLRGVVYFVTHSAANPKKRQGWRPSRHQLAYPCGNGGYPVGTLQDGGGWAIAYVSGGHLVVEVGSIEKGRTRMLCFDLENPGLSAQGSQTHVCITFDPHSGCLVVGFGPGFITIPPEGGECRLTFVQYENRQQQEGFVSQLTFDRAAGGILVVATNFGHVFRFDPREGKTVDTGYILSKSIPTLEMGSHAKKLATTCVMGVDIFDDAYEKPVHYCMPRPLHALYRGNIAFVFTKHGMLYVISPFLTHKKHRTIGPPPGRECRCTVLPYHYRAMWMAEDGTRLVVMYPDGQLIHYEI